jgi:uncharacterized membrane protein
MVFFAIKAVSCLLKDGHRSPRPARGRSAARSSPDAAGLYSGHRFSKEQRMDHKRIVTQALASAMALGLVGNAAAHEQDAKGKEKCYGVAKAGQNDCANLSGSHACSGMAKVDRAPDEWKYVAQGTCKQLKGLSEEQAKARLKKPSSGAP